MSFFPAIAGTSRAERLLAEAVLRAGGGKGSGNFKHRGRPGHEGGSSKSTVLPENKGIADIGIIDHYGVVSADRFPNVSDVDFNAHSDEQIMSAANRFRFVEGRVIWDGTPTADEYFAVEDYYYNHGQKVVEHALLGSKTTIKPPKPTKRRNLGGPGSGYFGHAGRPGLEGGSAPSMMPGIDARRLAEIEKSLRAAAKRMDFPPDDLIITSYDRGFFIGGQRFEEGGNYNPSTDKITLRSETVLRTTPAWREAMLAHEVMHRDWHDYSRAFGDPIEGGMPGWYETSQDGKLESADTVSEILSESPEQLEKEDGISNYSRAYWADVKKVSIPDRPKFEPYVDTPRPAWTAAQRVANTDKLKWMNPETGELFTDAHKVRVEKEYEEKINNFDDIAYNRAYGRAVNETLAEISKRDVLRAFGHYEDLGTMTDETPLWRKLHTAVKATAKELRVREKNYGKGFTHPKEIAIRGLAAVWEVQPSLVHMTIDGRSAIVAFMTSFNGIIVAPADASIAIATFDDGGIAYYDAQAPRALGGPGSGNFGHAGRPGHEGGSAPAGESATKPLSEMTAAERDLYTGVMAEMRRNKYRHIYGQYQEVLSSLAHDKRAVVFHGTSTALLESIAEKGLVPDASPGADAWRFKQLGRPDGILHVGKAIIKGRATSVFVTTNESQARYFAKLAQEMNPGSGAAVLRIDIPATNPPRIRMDEFSPALRVEGTIPPEWITAVATYDGWGRPDKVSTLPEAIRHQHRSLSSPTQLYVVILFDNEPRALGGPGSGNFGHAGRPGLVGGSATRDIALARHAASVDASNRKADVYRQAAFVTDNPDLSEYIDVNFIRSNATIDDIKRMNPEKITVVNAEEAERRVTEHANKLIADAHVAVRVKATDLGKIIADGRLKTQLETGTSGGDLDPQARKNIEYDLFGTPRTDVTDRAVYGYAFSDITHPKYDNAAGKNVSHYGDVSLILKDSVKDRTTFTSGDTLFEYDRDFRHKRAEVHADEDPLERRFAPTPMVGGDAKLGFDLFENRRILDAENVDEIRGQHGAVETQIHGGVKLSDIDRVVVHYGRALDSDDLNALVDRGIPVELRVPRSSVLDDQYKKFFAEHLPRVTITGGAPQIIPPFFKGLGGPGSGNFGHKGRKGKVGGSAPRGHGLSPEAVDAELATQRELANKQENPYANPIAVLGFETNRPRDFRLEGKAKRYVKAYGQPFKSQPRPAGVRQDEPNQCYRNASLLVMERDDLTYAEGFAGNGSGLAIWHAWAVDKDDNVVDPTLPDGEKWQYFGVKYDRAKYLASLYHNKFYGVIGGTDEVAKRAIETGGRELRAIKALGGEGSGNFNHAGRPGLEGGSAPSNGSIYDAPADSREVQLLASDEQIEWESSLSEDEKDVIKTYSGPDGRSFEINHYLRHPDGRASERLGSEIASLDSALAKASHNKVQTLYRGVNTYSVLEKLKVGAEFSDKGFVSTTLDPTHARIFGRNENFGMTILAIRTNKGAYISQITGPTGMEGREMNEYEWLLPRGLRYRVQSIDEKGIGPGGHLPFRIVHVRAL